MKLNVRVKLLMVLQLVAVMSLIFAGTSFAAEALSLQAAEPSTMYYTTNGTEVTAPATGQTAVTSFSLPRNPVESSEDKEKNRELKRNLLKKYDLERDVLTIRLEHTHYGKFGRINLLFKRNNIPQPTNIIESDKISHSYATSVVQNFIIDEADLFGGINLKELVETQYRVDELGFTLIELQKYIDQIPVEFAIFRFFIRPTGELSSVSARLFPSPPELYEAVKRETLPEEQIREIAMKTFQEVGMNLAAKPNIRNTMKVVKIAIPTPPYVLWKVESSWLILINAFTGEILEKRSLIRN